MNKVVIAPTVTEAAAVEQHHAWLVARTMTDPYSDVFGELTRTRSMEIIARHSQPRSALLHVVQSVEAHVSQANIAFCAEEFELTTAEVAAPATVYTIYKRTPCGWRLVSVCTTRYARHRAATRSASGVRPHPPRGAPLVDFRTVELELAGIFPDLAASVEGLSEAPETLLSVTVAADRGWAAPAMPDTPPALPEKR